MVHLLQTRLCSCCNERKTIRGVWYLLPDLVGNADHGSPFLCETCFAGRPVAPDKTGPLTPEEGVALGRHGGPGAPGSPFHA